jgi:hypothetical protein
MDGEPLGLKGRAHFMKRYSHMVSKRFGELRARRRRRSKSESTIPKRASATAASLQGRLRANNRRGRRKGYCCKLQSPRKQLTVIFEHLISSVFWFNFEVHFSVIYRLFNSLNWSGKSV